jgi:hypothetical protein
MPRLHLRIAPLERPCRFQSKTVAATEGKRVPAARGGGAVEEPAQRFMNEL